MNIEIVVVASLLSLPCTHLIQAPSFIAIRIRFMRSLKPTGMDLRRSDKQLTSLPRNGRRYRKEQILRGAALTGLAKAKSANSFKYCIVSLRKAEVTLGMSSRDLDRAP